MVFSLAAGACTIDYSDGDGLECDGKCDGIAHLTSLIRDAKELDLGDLVAVGSKFTAAQIDDALASSDFGSLQLDAPQFYALPGVADPDLTLENIDSLVTGLAARYGERELTTEVNATRRAHLMSSSDRVYVESAFSVNLDLGWSHVVGGLGDATLGVGFTAGSSLKARVIGAYRDELAGVKSAPLRALRDLRGFVFPRSLDEIRAMKPGESLALEGDGALGANLGVGVPILVANPGGGPITYSIVLSAGLRTRIAGSLDIQLVRLDGDQLVIDVGMEKVREFGARLALDDAWGVQGLLKTHIDLGGIDVDLGKLVDKALQKQLNAKLDLISAAVSTDRQASRVSVARLRFSLDGGDLAVLGPAIAQALHGDVRLAQALANRREPGVVAEFDLLRSGSSATSFAGLDLLGMRFFTTTIASQGQAVIQTPGGVRALMFESLHKQSGSFFSEHGYTRVGLSGLNFDPDNPGEARGEANLFVQLQEADKFMERDKMLDQVDAVILALAGSDAMHSIETIGNQLERFVEQTCPNSQAFDPCRIDVLSNPTVISLRQQGSAAASAAAGNLADTQRALLVELAEFRMTAQATYEPKASLVGPDSTWTIDFRFDDAALTQMMSHDKPADVKAAITNYATTVGIQRIRPPEQIDSDRLQIASDLKSRIDALVKRYATAQQDYDRLLGVEQAVVAKLGPIGPRALEIHVPVDASKRPLYESAVAGSLAEARSRVATALFDDFVKSTGGFPTRVEQATGYSLLALVDPSRIDLRVDAKMNLSDTFSQDFAHYRAAGYAPFDSYGKGADVATIDGGLFSIDAIIAGN